MTTDYVPGDERITPAFVVGGYPHSGHRITPTRDTGILLLSARQDAEREECGVPRCQAGTLPTARRNQSSLAFVVDGEKNANEPVPDPCCSHREEKGSALQ